MDESPSPPRREGAPEERADDEVPPIDEPETPVLLQEEEDADEDDPTGRLAAYLARTQTALDILALVTLWIVVVPMADFGDDHGLRSFGLSFRLVLSLIYGADMAIRTSLARRHWHYLRTHPVGVLAVLFPPVRVLFSLRLIRALFQRGNLPRFLVAALLLMINGALIVWLFERDVPGANIVTLGDSIWWSIVTVTTVGYGDYYPITVVGQAVATFIMFIGIVTVAVLTAQVASSFVDQSTKRAREREVAAADTPAPATAPPDPVGTSAEDAGSGTPTLAELDARMARIEAMLSALVSPGDGGPAEPASG